MAICINCKEDKDDLFQLTCLECIEKINKKIYGEFMKFEDIKNESNRKFKSIEKEAWRDYTYPGGDIICIESPIALSVSKSGHYVIDSNGIVNFFPNEWIRLRWQNKDGEPNLIF